MAHKPKETDMKLLLTDLKILVKASVKKLITRLTFSGLREGEYTLG
jgi:hypothetical protein